VGTIIPLFRPPTGVDPLTDANTPRCLLWRPPLGGVYRHPESLTDGVTLRASYVPPQNAGILALWHTACFHDTGRGLCFWCILLKLTNYKQMVYRNKVYRVIILHITYSFWGLRPQILTGLCPWTPLGDFRPPDPMVCHYTPCH